MIDNLAQPIACNFILWVRGSFQMQVERGLVYPHQTLLDDVQIDTSSYVVVNVNMVQDNLKDLKLEVPPDDTSLVSIVPEAHLSPSPNPELSPIQE
jgi:hypothetical protein